DRVPVARRGTRRLWVGRQEVEGIARVPDGALKRRAGEGQKVRRSRARHREVGALHGSAARRSGGQLMVRVRRFLGRELAHVRCLTATWKRAPMFRHVRHSGRAPMDPKAFDSVELNDDELDVISGGGAFSPQLSLALSSIVTGLAAWLWSTRTD